MGAFEFIVCNLNRKEALNHMNVVDYKRSKSTLTTVTRLTLFSYISNGIKQIMSGRGIPSMD